MGTLLFSALTVLQPAFSQAPAVHTASGLSSNEIEALLKMEYEADDDKSTVSRVQQLFSEYGIPKKELVGEQGVDDFVVLLVNDRPLAFMQKALPAVVAAANAGLLSSNEETFFRARMRQKTVEESLSTPTNPQLKGEIEVLIQKDQSVRQGSSVDPKKMQLADEQDRPAIRSILDHYGMPTFAMVGSEAANDFVIMIQHQPADFRQQALPMLKQNVDAGQANAKDYAMMYDRSQTDQGKPEIYGVNLICQPNGTVAPGPLDDPDHVEDRRASIGLIPLKTYIRMGNILTPPDFCKAASNPAKQ